MVFWPFPLSLVFWRPHTELQIPVPRGNRLSVRGFQLTGDMSVFLPHSFTFVPAALEFRFCAYSGSQKHILLPSHYFFVIEQLNKHCFPGMARGKGPRWRVNFAFSGLPYPNAQHGKGGPVFGDLQHWVNDLGLSPGWIMSL